MKIRRIRLDEINRCYSTGYVYVNGELKIILASEEIDGPCYSYSGEDFKNKEVVWEKGGGTMSIIPIPNTSGEFLASQGFFPGFNAKDSKIVHGKYIDGKWEINDFMYLPYVHRFDILRSGGINYFVGATLCTSKKDRNDWSDPGKIYVGKLPEDLSQPMEISVIQEGLTKNHGYCRSNWNGRECGFVTADEGVFVVIPPEKEGEEWTVKHIIERSVSDVAICDIDGDGVNELATIEPFHGTDYVINKKIGDEYKAVYKYPDEMEFVHVVWGGKIRDKATFIGGARRKDAELFMVQYKDGNYRTTIIDKGKGPANVEVINDDEKDIIITANNTIHEACVYIVEDD